MVRQPQAAECRSGGERAEDHRAGQARLQQLAPPRSPRRNEVNIERDADAEQEGQRDDVFEVERQASCDADAERDQPRQHKRRERQHHIARPAQDEREKQDDRKERPQSRLQESAHDGAARFLDRDRSARCFRSQ